MILLFGRLHLRTAAVIINAGLRSSKDSSSKYVWIKQAFNPRVNRFAITLLNRFSVAIYNRIVRCHTEKDRLPFEAGSCQGFSPHAVRRVWLAH